MLHNKNKKKLLLPYTAYCVGKFNYVMFQDIEAIRYKKSPRSVCDRCCCVSILMITVSCPFTLTFVDMLLDNLISLMSPFLGTVPFTTPVQ